MKAPNKIFLQVCGSCTEEGCEDCKFEDLEDNVTWCKDRIYKKDIEYIRKDALLEWAKEQASITEKLNGKGAMLKAWDSLINKIESL